MIKLTQEEIDALHCKYGSRQEFYKLELVDKYGIKKDNLQLINGTISVDCDADIQRSATIEFIETLKVNYLTDRIKPYMGVRLAGSIKWWPLGVFLMLQPNPKKGKVSVQCYDETILLQQSQVLKPKLFLKGTNYGEVLRYFLISCGITKINIQSTELTLPSDLIVDDSKNKLEWFNYIAEQINYTKLSVNADGWFISKKYIEPSPSNVGYVYEANRMSVMTDDIESITDYWKVPNVFKRTVSRPDVGELTSIYKNEDPTNPFSTVSRGFEIVDNQLVDNVANQIELDNLTRKAAFNANQVYQEVTFYTLNMPHHENDDILDLRHPSLKGIFMSKHYSITLKSGSLMTHRAKRLVTLND